MIQVTYIEFETEADMYARIFIPNGCKGYTLYHFLSPMAVSTDSGVQTADLGACIIYGPNEMQDISALRDSLASVVYFDMPEDEFNAFSLPLSTIFYPDRKSELVSQLLNNIHTEFHTRDFGHLLQMNNLMSELLLQLSRNFYDLKIQPEGEPQLYHLFCQARSFMLKNCDKEWASNNMCEMVSMKKSQFYKYYEEYFGISPKNDLNNARIQRAKHLLLNHELAVTKVSTLCGYKSITHFSRTFKEHTGMSPLAYQKLMENI